MEKASSFFVIIINDLYDEVIYVKKDGLRAVGRLIVTLILMGFAIAFMFKFPNYSWSAVFFVALLVIWDFMYYKDFQYFKFGKKGIEAKANTIKNNLSESSNTINYHNEFEKMIRPSSTALRVNPMPYESPTRLNVFLHLRSEAKNAGFDFENDSMYIQLRRQIQSDVAFNLVRSIKAVYDTNELSPYSNTLLDWCRIIPVNEKEIMNICKSIYSENGKKDKLIMQFAKAINDLKQIDHK